MVGLRLLALAGLLSLETAGASAIFGVVIQDATSPRGLTAITATSPAPLQSYAALAWGMYNDTITTNGWSFMDVHTNASALYNDTQTAAAAGYLEGYVTAQRTYEFIMNVHGGKSIFGPQLEQYVVDNLEYVRGMAEANRNSDPLWHQVDLLYTQLRGAHAGYLDAAEGSQYFDFLTFYSATMIGDLDDLCPALGCNRSETSTAFLAKLRGSKQQQELTRKRYSDGHCSVLIKAIADPTNTTWVDLIAGHTTWNPLETMTRVWKNYEFPFAVTAARESQLKRSAALDGALKAGRTTVNVAEPSASPSEAAQVHVQASLPTYDREVLQQAVDAGAVVPGAQTIFSSYPGVLYSFDDWYQTYPALLMVTETTIINNNASLYSTYINANNSISDWARNMASNRLSNSGSDWMTAFGRYNSGTYNNEFMVVDFKLFAGVKNQPIASNPLPAGLLYVGEQMPGYWVYEDRTPWLTPAASASAAPEHSRPAADRSLQAGPLVPINGAVVGPGQGYYASFNRPSFPLIYNVSNQWTLYQTYGDHFSWELYARAQIFRRDQWKVVDSASYQTMLRYNDYTQDPISTQACTKGSSASNAISERGDLTPVDGSSQCCAACGLTRQDEGGIDCKYTTSSMMTASTFASTIQSGPTTSGGQLPPFQWSTSPFDQSVNHAGQPDLFDFPWVTVSYSV